MAPPSALRAATFPSLRDREDHYVPTGRLLPLPLSIRVERSRDTRRSCAKPDGHLDFARCERMGWATATSGRKIGRASGRDRVCQSGSISVVAVSLKKKKNKKEK